MESPISALRLLLFRGVLICTLLLAADKAAAEALATPTDSSRRNSSSSSVLDDRINIALHAQSRFERHGWVAGSEITTAGILRAFSRHASVGTVQVFAPFSYDGLEDTRWDLVVIEGFIGPVPRFIRKVRRLNPEVVVLHFCLDTYPTLNTVLSLDVDGYLTNSQLLKEQLEKFFPTALVHLAVDIDAMRPVEMTHKLDLHHHECSNDLEAQQQHHHHHQNQYHQQHDRELQQTEKRERYSHNVVYLGQMKDSKHRLVEVLKEVAPLGLAIYGIGWEKSESAKDLLPYWKGILPLEDIAILYSSSKVIIGTTEEKQRSLGMINNRVFEVLACGTPLVSDHFPSIESVFGDHLQYFKRPGDAFKAVQSLLANDTWRYEVATRGRAFVSTGHSYDHRVIDMLTLFHHIRQLQLQLRLAPATEDKLQQQMESSAVEKKASAGGERAAQLDIACSAAVSDDDERRQLPPPLPPSPPPLTTSTTTTTTTVTWPRVNAPAVFLLWPADLVPDNFTTYQSGGGGGGGYHDKDGEGHVGSDNIDNSNIIKTAAVNDLRADVIISRGVAGICQRWSNLRHAAADVVSTTGSGGGGGSQDDDDDHGERFLPAEVRLLLHKLRESGEFRVMLWRWPTSSSSSSSEAAAAEDEQPDYEGEVRRLCRAVRDGLILAPWDILMKVTMTMTLEQERRGAGNHEEVGDMTIPRRHALLAAECHTAAKGVILPLAPSSSSSRPPSVLKPPWSPIFHYDSITDPRTGGELALRLNGHATSSTASNAGNVSADVVMDDVFGQLTWLEMVVAFRQMQMRGEEGEGGERSNRGDGTGPVSRSNHLARGPYICEQATGGSGGGGGESLSCHPNSVFVEFSAAVEEEEEEDVGGPNDTGSQCDNERGGKEHSKFGGGGGDGGDSGRGGREDVALPALDRAIYGVRATASVRIVDPPNESTVVVRLPDKEVVTSQLQANDDGGDTTILTINVGVNVTVELNNFASPADGMWCVEVEGVQLLCVGDNIGTIHVVIPIRLKLPSYYYDHYQRSQRQQQQPPPPLTPPPPPPPSQKIQLEVTLCEGLAMESGAGGQAVRRSHGSSFWIKWLTE